MSDAALCLVVLGATLALFVSERVRHDLVALLALAACLVLGLVPSHEALLGFADPAVIAVAAILVVGRAVELSGIAAGIARVAIPAKAPFTTRMAALLCVGAVLSAFMNNIAALVITMPVAGEIARSARKPPAATLMPLAFATILGGMTTLIGTPANLILSSVREEQLGQPFGFFSMTAVGGSVALAGLLYLAIAGWRLLPARSNSERDARSPWRVFELTVSGADNLVTRLRSAKARAIACFRSGAVVPLGAATAGDRLLVISRDNPWSVAEATGLISDAPAMQGPEWATARVVVGHGSHLIGQGYEAITNRSAGHLTVVAAGPRTARLRQPLGQIVIEPGDQLFVRGSVEDIAAYLPRARLLEIDRLDRVPTARARSLLVAGVFALAVVAIVLFSISPAIAFLGAAISLAVLRLVPADEVYHSIDWSVVVLLAAMIPVGHSFQASGAAAMGATMLGQALGGAPLFIVLAALCALTLLLSIFLNNVATAIIMGPLVLDTSALLNVSPDAALLAVLIGASSDFLTPIGHQNNLLVMGPGGYRFADYARMGAPLVAVVVLVSAGVLTVLYG